MPYMIVGSNIYKKLPNGKRGELVGKSSKKKVKAYLRALYAHTKGER